MTKESERVYVHPNFKKLLKVEAATKGMDIIDLTESITKEENPLHELAETWNKKYKKVCKDWLDFP